MVTGTILLPDPSILILLFDLSRTSDASGVFSSNSVHRFKSEPSRLFQPPIPERLITGFLTGLENSTVRVPLSGTSLFMLLDSQPIHQVEKTRPGVFTVVPVT